ncbi:MAG: DNA-binding protein [Proteobacteria bacterium]|nr:DNA-binding protein [Pseudomonadota bacterium]
MALFFDKDWFDTRLKAVHLTRRDLAAALCLSEAQMEEVFKDQRELSLREVVMLGALLDKPASEIANRAGISTPVPGEATDPAKDIRVMKERLDRIERVLAELVAMLEKTKL